MTREEYHAIVENYEQHCIDLAVSRIPSNINRAGKLYKKKLQAIRESLWKSPKNKY